MLTASSLATEILCHGGLATVTVEGAGGTAPYDGAGIVELAAGDYSFQITDSNGCTATTSVSISQPEMLTLSSATTLVTGFECADGTISLSGSGGTGSYTYSIDNGSSYQESGLSTDLAAGSYSVVVMDGNGCTATATITVDTKVCPGTTITMGGWGANCSGGNWGCYLTNNWSLTGGAIVVGSGSRFLALTSAKAVIAYLPSGGTPSALDKSYSNPTEKSYKNTLAGQAVATTINVKMFGIGDLVVTSGPYAGFSVNAVLDAANTALGGGGGSVVDLTSALDQINRNFDNGTVDLGFLGCPCINAGGRQRLAASDNRTAEGVKMAAVETYPNPFNQRSTIDFSVAETTTVNLTVYGSNGNKIVTLFNGTAQAGERYSSEFIAPSNGLFIYRLMTSHGSVVGKLMAQK